MHWLWVEYEQWKFVKRSDGVLISHPRGRSKSEANYHSPFRCWISPCGVSVKPYLLQALRPVRVPHRHGIYHGFASDLSSCNLSSEARQVGVLDARPISISLSRSGNKWPLLTTWIEKIRGGIYAELTFLGRLSRYNHTWTALSLFPNYINLS